jgi:hypothetical protein
MAKIPKNDQSRNTSRNYKSREINGLTRTLDIPEVGSGAS